MAKPRSKSIVDAIAESGFQNLAATCPHCGTRNSAFVKHTDLKQSLRLAQDTNPRGVSIYALRCEHCHQLVVGRSFVVPNPKALSFDPSSMWNHINELLWPHETWPDNAPEEMDDANARADYDEARRVLSASPQAAAMLARRCLQHVIRAKMGIKKPTLNQEVQEALTREDLSKPTKECLHHVRTIGNWGAHPSLDVANTLMRVSQEEAEYTIKALEEVFDDLYEKTARAARMTSHIANKQAGSGS